MRGPLPLFEMKPVLMLKPQAVTSGTANGPWITEPSSIGSHLLVILLGGVFAAVANGAAVLQGKKRSDGTAANLVGHDGTSLVFTATKLDDGGELETSGIVVGTIPLEYVDNDYSAVRLSVTEDGGAAMNIAAVGVICNLRDMPSGLTDDLIAKIVKQFALPT